MDHNSSRPTRLLHTASIKLVENPPVLPYAILSHTWDRDEVLYHDVDTDKVRSKAGWRKIVGACRRAAREGFKYIWVDTCCIDKTNLTELSEAINSMFAWYKGAAVCYVYLADVLNPNSARQDAGTLDSGLDALQLGDYVMFHDSRWFTRGWTLQELLAPRVVRFYARDWAPLGTLRELSRSVWQTTGISIAVLTHQTPIIECSVAQRLSWAAYRQTTRVEDAAYSLLGILGVNMPLLYGEGANSFVRLQEEVLRRSGDLSILAWSEAEETRQSNLLAGSPLDFKNCGDIVLESLTIDASGHWMTSAGLRGSLSVLETESLQTSETERHAEALLSLHCVHGASPLGILALRVRMPDPENGKEDENTTYLVSAIKSGLPGSGTYYRLGTIDIGRKWKMSRVQATIQKQGLRQDIPQPQEDPRDPAGTRSLTEPDLLLRKPASQELELSNPRTFAGARVSPKYYVVNTEKFFQVGRIFKVFDDQTLPDQPPSGSRPDHFLPDYNKVSWYVVLFSDFGNSRIDTGHSLPRRFHRPEHCIVAPILRRHEQSAMTFLHKDRFTRCSSLYTNGPPPQLSNEPSHTVPRSNRPLKILLDQQLCSIDPALAPMIYYEWVRDIPYDANVRGIGIVESARELLQPVGDVQRSKKQLTRYSWCQVSPPAGAGDGAERPAAKNNNPLMTPDDDDHRKGTTQSYERHGRFWDDMFSGAKRTKASASPASSARMDPNSDDHRRGTAQFHERRNGDVYLKHAVQCRQCKWARETGSLRLLCNEGARIVGIDLYEARLQAFESTQSTG